MDPEFMKAIAVIQSVKQDLYKKHKPQLIDATKSNIETSNVEEDQPDHHKAFEKIIKQQRKIIYRKNPEALEKSKKKEDPETKKESISTKEIDETIQQKIGVKVSTKQTKADTSNDLQKPWNKLTNNLKMSVVLKFIETLSLNIEETQAVQLRYLLISSISQRKLNKISDVDYDSENSCINKINCLIFENGAFKLLDNDAGERAIGLKSFLKTTSTPTLTPVLPSALTQPINKPKKIILIKK